MSKQLINLFLVSDSSGETVLTVGRSVLAQFEGLKVEYHMWPMIREQRQIDNLIEAVHAKKGMILYTIVNKQHRTYMKERCKELGIQYISAISHVIVEFSEHLGIPAAVDVPGMQHSELDQNYFKRIDAIDFALYHDDGRNVEDAHLADMILLGVSRTSKTPTTFYLAHRGYKVLNIPIITGTQIAVDFKSLPQQKCYGLTISAEKLMQVRTNRLSHLGVSKWQGINEYIDHDSIKLELQNAKRLYSQHGFTMIDVTNKAVEEIAAEIINYHEHLKAG